MFASILLAQFFIKQTLPLFFLLMASPVELVFIIFKHKQTLSGRSSAFHKRHRLVNIFPCKTVFDQFKATLVALVNYIWQRDWVTFAYLCNQQLESKNKSVFFIFHP